MPRKIEESLAIDGIYEMHAMRPKNSGNDAIWNDDAATKPSRAKLRATVARGAAYYNDAAEFETVAKIHDSARDRPSRLNSDCGADPSSAAATVARK